MYYHGINAEYLHFHFPVINPTRSEHRKTAIQMEDSLRLKKRFGFEPVHLLECTSTYTKQECLSQCKKFGDTIFVFESLPLPILYLSRHERGVIILDIREASYCYITKLVSIPVLKTYVPDLPIRIDSNLRKRIQ